MTSRTPEGVDPGPGTVSLRVRLYAISLLLAGVGTLGFLVLLGVSLRAQGDLATATEAFMEEERIADAVTVHVMDQLATAFALRTAPEMELRDAFQESGRAAHGEVRRYLFRDLAPEERLQLETMAEAHQRMEVAGLRAADLFARGQVAEAEASWAAMLEHNRDFLAGMATFLQMRQRALDVLQTEQARTFRRVIGASVVLALLLLAMAGTLAWTVDRRMTRPLARLARASERFGSGEMDVRVPLWRDRELRQLASGFNRMADRLQETKAELESQNRELSQAMENLKRTQDELVQAEKLSALGRMSAGLAHELNNPLTSVIGYAQLLEERLGGERDPPGPDELRGEFLSPIVSEANRARQLVRNLLHFTRRAEAELKAVSVADAMDVVLGLHQGRFAEAGVVIRMEPLPEIPVLAEPSLLQAVFLNIVTNALDAIDPRGQGTLWIRGSSGSEEVRVVLEDDGPGLPDPERVFEPFYTTKPPGQGTGLGLSLVHRFMEHFGGGVEADHRPGGGARFTLTFRKAEKSIEAPATSGRAVGESRSAPPRAPSRAGDDPGEIPWILVLEDEAPIRELHGRLLTRLGVRPLLAESAASARELMDGAEELAAVLCDVRMPGETGLEFYRWLQGAHPGLAERLLFVTGDVGDPELLALLAERPDLFLHKPFSIEEYGQRVRALLDRGPVRPT